MIKWLTIAVCTVITMQSLGQGVQFGSSDTVMVRAFDWAKEQALHYKGKPGDPVGLWYESALPPRNAFCMRDMAHQSIGAAILGLNAENKNMATLFAHNISESKNWCSYWEINKSGLPAPEDYRSDQEFWYNLDANFDILDATWRLASWTGDYSYIEAPVFKNFQEKTVGPYIDSWVLQADSLLSRPEHPNAPVPYTDTDAFDRCRGLPSYSEGIADIRVGVDLVAALYRGLMTYADILRYRGNNKEANQYAQKAERYRTHLESDWWDNSMGRYHTWYSKTGEFGVGEGETFLLWFDILQDTARAKRTIGHLASKNWNIENTSYFPFLFYREGFWDLARKTILYLSDPGTERREYPEVSYGVVQGVVLGLLGIGVLPGTHTVTSLYRSRTDGSAWVRNLPVLGTELSITHKGLKSSSVTNTGKKDIIWRACFSEKHASANINGIATRMQTVVDKWGHTVSYVEMSVAAGANAVVTVK